MSGYYLMPRGWMDMPALDASGEAYCRRAAWVWLIENARWAAGPVNVMGKTVHLQRGQMSFSTRFLATAWRWPQTTVRRFLERLSRDGHIECSGSEQSIITICNYSAYTLHDADGGSGPAQGRLRSGSNENTLMQDIYIHTGGVKVQQPSNVLTGRAAATPFPLSARTDDKSGQTTLLPTADVVSVPTIAMQFEEFYRLYPKKKKKPEALAAYHKALKLISHEELLEAVRTFPWDGNVAYYPYPASWLNGQRWLDEVEAPKAAKRAESPTKASLMDPSDPFGIQTWCQNLLGVKPAGSATEKARGNWLAFGYIIDSVARCVAEAAEFPINWRGDWSPLREWLEAGYEPDAIVDAITRAVEKTRSQGKTYAPGDKTLGLFFNNWVRASRKVA
jgi:hypothetical protein